MTIATRLTSLTFVALLAAACGEPRGTNPTVETVTIPGGASDGSSVTVEVGKCTLCHGDAARTAALGDAAGVQLAPPIDVAGATTGAKVGAHQAHLKSGVVRTGIDCATCHVVPQNPVQHSPGVGFRYLANAQPWTAPRTAPSYANGTCSATYCHGNFRGGVGDTVVANADVSWTGGTPTCGVSCHQTPPPNAVHSGKAFPASCPSCHGGTVDASGAILTAGGLHINGAIDGATCTGCHGTDGRPNGGIAGVSYDSNQAASPPVDTNGASTGVLVGVHLAHVNPTPSVAGATQPTGGVYKPIACTECHPYDTNHPNNTITVTFAAATGADLASFSPTFTQGNGTSTATTCSTYCHNGRGIGTATSWTGAAATCSSCHGFPPVSHTTVGSNATECNGCHDGTVNADGTINIAGGLHINGVVDGGESTGGLACGGCHDTIVAAMTGAATSKHSLTLDTTTATSGDWTGATLTGSVTVGSRSCVNMCHGDHPHDLTSPVVATHEYNAFLDASTATTRDAVNRTSTTRSKTDFVASGGGLCVSCHQRPISSASGPTVQAADYAGSAHDFTAFTAGTTWTWQYVLHSGAFDRNCTKCHASSVEGNTPAAGASGSPSATAVHTNTNPTLLAGKTNPAGSLTGFVCINCHGSTATPAAGAQGNRSGVDVQTPITATSRHPVATDAVHDTVAEDATGYNSGAFSGGNRHVNCLDCHTPHAAGTVLHSVGTNALAATSPLNGVSGVAFTPPGTNWTTTTSANLAMTSPATLEYQVCFKCHSSFAFGTTPPTALSGLVETDVAMDFNPNNHSVHPIAGPNTYWPLNQPATRLGGQWTAGVGKTMFCSDCHGSNTSAGAQGPHGSAAKYILKGNGTAQSYWPTNSSGNYYELGGTVTGLFCLNCHPNLNSTTSPQSNTLHRNGNHRGNGFACIDCHVRVPHGGKIPRLLITNTAGLPARLKDPNAWATTGRTPAWPGDTPPAAWARPTTVTNDMGTSNCTACGQHNCSSGTCEAW